MTQKRLKILATAAVLAMAMGNASAALISGSVGLTGNWIPMDTALGGGSPTTIELADGIDFLSQDIGTATGDFLVNLTPGVTPVTINDFDFDPLSPSPVDPLWTAGIFDFELTSVSIVLQQVGSLTLTGTGLVTAIGFDDTPATWSFSSQGGGLGTFTWSSNNTAVPLPPAAWLFGSAIVGLVGVARRRRSTSARTLG